MATERTWRPARETPFVGREVELDALSSILRHVLRGKPRVAVVAGEAGVGKTRLIREFALIARHLDVYVVQGRAIEDSSVPYLPLMSVLRRSHAPVAPGSPSEGADATNTAGLVASLSGTVAPLATTVGNAVRNGEHDRLRIFLAVTQEVIALAHQQPTLIILDDLHWADPSSLDLLEHLVFAAADAADFERLPLMVLITHRPIADDHRLGRLLDRIRRESLTDAFEIEGLGSAETAAIVRALEPSPASNQLIQAVQAATRGYPLFIQEFVEQLRADGLLEQAGGYTTVRSLPAGVPSPPRDVSDAVTARLKPLSSEDMPVLNLAALLGDSFTAEQLARVAGAHADAIAPRLASALDQKVIVVDQAGFRFRHPLLRRALAGSVSPARRQAIHLQIATALSAADAEASGATSVEIADHLLAAGPQADPARVIEHARRGADHAFSVFAWAEAARLYAGAADAASAAGTVHGSALGELQFLAGLAHQHDFDIGPCLDRYERAMRAFEEAGDFAGQAQTLRHQTRVRYITTGTTNYGDAIDLERHERVLAALGDSSPLVRGLLLEVMSQVCWTTRNSARAEALARRALDLGERIGDDRLRHYASFSLGLAQFQGGHLDEALESYERSIEYARRADDPWIENPPLQRLSLIAHGCGRLDDADRLARQGRELTGRVAYAAEASYAFANLATTAVARGRFREAEGLAREAITLTRRTRYPWGGLIALLALASARTQQGRFQDARHALRLLRTPGEVLEQPGATVQFMVTAMEDLIVVHEGPGPALGEIQDRVTRLGALIGAAPFDANATSGMCAVVEIAAAVGAADAARVAHSRLARLFQAGLVLTSGGVFGIPRVLALGAVLLGDEQAAAKYFLAAEDSARTSGARPELGRSLLDHACFLLKEGDEDALRAAGERALLACAIFDEVGMAPYFDRAARLAESCGLVAPSPSPRSRKGELERREVELLERVARGRSPQEIAAEQLLDPESVADEIERLFAKIDVSGPALAAAYAFGHGIVGPESSPTPGPLVLMVTDMVGFTSFVERVGDARAQTTIHVHNRTIRFQLTRHHGKEVTHTGDGMMASFSSGDDAVACAIAIQRQLTRYSEEHPDAPIRVRIGLNAGRVLPEEDRLFGAALNAAVRVCARAEAGQVLLSASALAMTSEGVASVARELGTFPLKGFANPMAIYELPWSA
jgi:class 3 adenylate cyclase/tetratricopeptide (TPR) repeat protein